jgi:hypothetical protein
MTFEEGGKTHLAIVTIFAENTNKRDIILIALNTFKAIKTTPDGREGKNGLISGILMTGGGSYCKARRGGEYLSKGE